MHTKQQIWLSHIRAFAIVWIVLNHLAERLFGYPLIANPTQAWPPFDQRLAQLVPLSGNGWWDVPLNLLRYVGWFGDQGVQLFLIASGFGLTWSLLQRGDAPLDLRQFYQRRLLRIYPHYWLAHGMFVLLALATPLAIWLTQPHFYASLLGLRFTPGLLYWFSPSWWYFTLILQLYLIFPLLWWALRRFGPLQLLLLACLIGFAARALGVIQLTTWSDAWLRGMFFPTRLPEFVFGMSFAAILRQAPDWIDNRLRSPLVLFGAALGWLAGMALALTEYGMIIAPLMLGVALWVLLYALFGGLHARRTSSTSAAIWEWLDRRSYALFLTHHPPLLLLIFPESEPIRVVAQVLLALGIGLLLAELLDRSATALIASFAALRSRAAWLQRLLLAGGGLALIVGLLIGADLVVQRFDPQETTGWGERVMLQPDEQLGYRMRENGSFHLRWESYDYTAQSNELGFPAPSYPAERTPVTYRIMTVGDAFTSAEGVDTNLAWPRLLEQNLRTAGTATEVLNFAVTGYGPNQYAVLAREYLPIYQPDLLIVGLFVNDFQDAQIDNTSFQQSIGLDREQSPLRETLQILNLRRWLEERGYNPLAEWLSGSPNPDGYALGHFATIERGREEIVGSGRQAVAERLREVAALAQQHNTDLLIVLIPAGPQICRANDLDYFPTAANLNNTSRYDIDQPQRLASAIAADLGITTLDLRLALQSVPSCPYQPRNMHWLPAGHELVAATIQSFLADMQR
ncbi:MAG: hypothetical protein Fur005_26240 [Roseiflexaceae bacterium]